MVQFLRTEWALVASVITAALFAFLGESWLEDPSRSAWLAFLTAWLFAVMALATSAHSLRRN